MPSNPHLDAYRHLGLYAGVVGGVEVLSERLNKETGMKEPVCKVVRGFSLLRKVVKKQVYKAGRFLRARPSDTDFAAGEKLDDDIADDLVNSTLVLAAEWSDEIIKEK